MIAHRAQRISEALREELNEMIGYEMSDPRVQDVEVIEVILSPDGKKAQVRLSVPGGETKQREALEAVEHARSFFKRELNIRLHMFRIPEIKFGAEGLPENGSRLDFLFRRIKRGRPREGQDEAQAVEHSAVKPLAVKKDAGQ